MNLFWFIFIAVVYLIGLLTVKWLDKVFAIQNNKYHVWVLLIMWILTPIILVAFILDFIWRLIRKTIK